MIRVFRSLLVVVSLVAAGAFTAAALASGAYYYVRPSLPNPDSLKDVRFQTPLRIYTRDGRLIQEFGEQKRTPVRYESIPGTLINAFVAAEDDRFFQHLGFDWAGTLKGVYNFVRVGGSERVPGGSTITQQVAREYFLSREYALARKIKELFLALQIERELTKREILELFCNTMFFGQSSYGVVTAAQTYFGKDLSELTLSETAVIAGILQGPSIMNPVSSVENAAARRAYVLRRMSELDMITSAEREAALAEPIESRRHGLRIEVDAPYVAEMVRLEMMRRFGPEVDTSGLRVTTTIDSRLQRAASRAVRANVIEYDERHGYRGPVARLDLDAIREAAEGEPDWRAALADYPDIEGFETGLVVAIHEQGVAEDELAEIPLDSIGQGPPGDPAVAEVWLRGKGFVTVGLDAVQWASPYISADNRGPRPKKVGDVLAPGQIVRFRRIDDGSLRLAQLPEVQGSLVALDPADGAIVSLVGGFDFFLSQFNNATQSRRQPGSSFKPFMYSAALEHGYTTASIINDNALSIESAELETVWRPDNYEGTFHGPTRLREALVNSYNTSAARVLIDIGPSAAIRHMSRFGFDSTALPRDASGLALGSGGVAPVDLATGFASFANGGYDVDYYFVDRVTNADGEVLIDARPTYVCGPYEHEAPELPAAVGARMPEQTGPSAGCDRQEGLAAPDEADEPELVADASELYPDIRPARRVVSAQNAYLIADMMRDVVRRGSGARAWRELQRTDLAGKTGTTNDRRDAWFSGFNRDIVASSWVGFLDNRPMGRGEQGGVTAIPAWISFMREALRGQPERWLEQPPGIVEVRIDQKTGLVVGEARPGTMFEKFRVGNVPDREPERAYGSGRSDSGASSGADEERIF